MFLQPRIVYKRLPNLVYSKREAIAGHRSSEPHYYREYVRIRNVQRSGTTILHAFLTMRCEVGPLGGVGYDVGSD